ncbi:ATP-binding protein [Paenibacillus sp. N3/727]|uniref:hybrid sensor histidine kinase/response regulator n=1 Tax=Paenibacillus sp. N3/727 TaxID=2925845 RepID=UPI001F5343F7|nr:ATP-binding protein [Paenibacillus sp. N3/727]UNK17567.1 ATP-binding protein [Paenibacillus sp. N3/727]
MMTKRKVFITLALFLVSLTLLRIGWLSFYNTPDHPKAVQGKLDLRDWDISSNRPISLDGEWEFYPNRFLLHEETHHNISTQDTDLIQVPGNWKAKLSTDHKTAEGYGSYRLRILVNPDKHQTYSLYLSNIQTSFELFVNSHSLTNSGHPASTREQYTAKNAPSTVTFSSDQSEIELVIHVANFDNILEGGVLNPIRFGTGATVGSEQSFTISLQIMMVIVFLLHAIYAGILFIIGYRQKSLIFLSLSLIFGVFSILIDDSQLLLSWLPLNYEWNVKIFLLSYMGTALFLLNCVRFAMHEYTAVRSFSWLTILNLMYMMYMMFILLAPAKYILFSVPFFYLLYFPTYLVMPVLAVRIALRTSKDALLLVLVASALTTNVFWGIVKNLGFIDMMYYPFDLIITLITLASFWFKRFIQTANQTKQLAKKLQMTDKLKDDFLANTSHELRTPLHGMINIAQHVLDEEKESLNKQNAQNLELLLTVGQRMSHTLNDLLDLSQLKEGRIHLELDSIRVQSAASGVVDMLKFMTEGKMITLSMDIPDSFPRVIADEKRLVQILYNLVHNAIKFTYEGTISINAELRNGQAFIHVSDSGVGMDEELKNRAFQAYEQGDTGTSTTIGGIGLGLSICQQMVKLHGGTLTVRSTPGQGSVFTFTLRLSDREEMDSIAMIETSAPYVAASDNDSKSDLPPLKPIPASDRPKILAVDDDTVNLKILGDILSSDQYDVVKVTNGKDAILKLDSAQWDLIIADVMMPQMSGYELTQLIRERYTVSELPILLLTARSQPEDINSGFLSGANDYITKPINAFELKPRVKALTDLKRSVGQRMRLEAAYLQAQIKPHFLFNTLNSITALSEFDLPKMNDLIDAFSSYLRISFDFWNSQQLVPIRHELELVHSYLYIEKQRFENRLNFIWDVQPDIHVMLPPLSIQPLVENAVRHGVLSLSKGGTVQLRVERRDHCIEILVEDNGVGMKEDKLTPLLHFQASEKRGIGLLNTDRRLKQLYGEGLKIWSQPNQGTKVSFKIPLD